MEKGTHRVRFLIVSDTHGYDFFGDDDGQRDPFWILDQIPKADVVLHCGDLTNMGSIPDHVATLTMLSTFRAELKLVIAGNHDISLDVDASNCSPEMQQAHKKAIKMWTGKETTEAGIIYLNEGLHTFALKNGATFTIYASRYTPEFNNWAFGYAHHMDRFNTLSNLPKSPSGTPDIVMTHGPPLGHLDSAHGKTLECRHLLKAVRNVRPRLHCFGHIHESAGAQIVDWTSSGDTFDTSSSLPENSNNPVDPAGIAANANTRLKKRHRTFIQDSPHPEMPINLSTGSKHECGGTTGRTLMLNAAMVDGANKPRFGSPWIVDMNLPSGTA